MRSLRIFTVTALIASLTACEHSPVPTDVEPGPTFGAAVTPKEVVVLSLDNTIFVPCANEDVRFFGDVPFWNHFTETPSGNVILHTTIPGAPFTPPFFAEGQSSGILWIFERTTSTFTNVLANDGAVEVFHASSNEVYISEDGDVLKFRSTFNLTVNPNRTITVSHGPGWTCQ